MLLKNNDNIIITLENSNNTLISNIQEVFKIRPEFLFLSVDLRNFPMKP